MEFVVVALGVGILVYLASRVGKPTGPSPEPGPAPPSGLSPEPAPGGPSAPAPEPTVGLAPGVLGGLKDLYLHIADPPGPGQVTFVPIPETPPEDQQPPGFSPSNPIPSTSLYLGFRGYFEIQYGDSMSKLAVRLGMAGRDWRLIRDLKANDWCKAASDLPRIRRFYGESGIALEPNWGKITGTDCGAPGWNAIFYNLAMPKTMQYPVLYWDGSQI